MKTVYIFCLLSCLTCKIQAQLDIVSVNSGKWNDVNTWSSKQIPSQMDNILILPGHTVSISSMAACASLTISNTSELKQDSSSQLKVVGNWFNYGHFSQQYSSIEFNGALPQFISGNTTFLNLIINNTNGVNLHHAQNVKGTLTLVSGTLNTLNNKLTLLADSNGTAKISAIPAGADIKGNITVQKFINSKAMGWRFLSSPVKTTLIDWTDNITTSGFPGSAYPAYNFCSVYAYNKNQSAISVNAYEIPNSIQDSLIPGNGYWCWIGAMPTLIEVTGSPAKFEQHFNVTLTASDTKNEKGWNMIANPYPSSINWESQAWTKNGIQNAIYIWNVSKEQYSVYSNGVSINGGSNIIESGQAFMVRATVEKAKLSCNESVKTNADKKQNNQASKVTIGLTVSGNGYSDETVICLSADANNEVSANEDAVKLYSENPLVPSLTSVVGSQDLAINTVKPGHKETLIRLKIKTGVSGTYTITSPVTQNLPSNACIYLEDIYNGKMIDFNNEDVYSFTASAGSPENRFILHIGKPVLAKTHEPACVCINGTKHASFNIAGRTRAFSKKIVTAQGNILRNLYMEEASITGYNSFNNLIK